MVSCQQHTGVCAVFVPPSTRNHAGSPHCMHRLLEWPRHPAVPERFQRRRRANRFAQQWQYQHVPCFGRHAIMVLLVCVTAAVLLAASPHRTTLLPTDYCHNPARSKPLLCICFDGACTRRMLCRLVVAGPVVSLVWLMCDGISCMQCHGCENDLRMQLQIVLDV